MGVRAMAQIKNLTAVGLGCECVTDVGATEMESPIAQN